MLNKLKIVFLENSTSSYIKKIHLIFLVLITIVVYINIFQNNFIGDDKETFFNWPDMQNTNIIALARGSHPPNFKEAPQYRPVKSIIHAFFYKISNNNKDFYHLQAIIVQIIIILLIYLITQALVNKSSLSFLSGILFAIHPIHTEAVSFITASFDTIGILFYFTSLFLYIKSTNSFKNKIRYYSLSIFFALLAFFSYELTLSLPLILILYDTCFNKQKVKRYTYYIPYFSLIILYFVLRQSFIPGITDFTYLGGSAYLTMLTMLKAFLMYCYTIIWPTNLSVIQVLPGDIIAFSTADIYQNLEKVYKQSIIEPSVIFAIIIILNLIITFIYCIRKAPVISFSIGLFFIALIPVSNIIPLREIMTIRFAYIASYGAILLFSCLVFNIYESKKNPNLIKNLLIFFITFIIIIFSYITIVRNQDWKSELSMFKSQSKQEVGGYYAKYFLGKYYFSKGDYKTSLYYLEKLANSRYDKVYPDAYLYLGFNYIAQNNFAAAKKSYLKLIDLDPNFKSESFSILKALITRKDNEYKNDNFSFIPPAEWNTQESPNEIIFTKPNTNFVVKLNYTILSNQYKIQTRDIKNIISETNGKLIQEGQVNFSTSEFSYVKIWDINGQQEALFLLINGKNLITIRLFPFDSENTLNFKILINSLKFFN